MPYFLQHRHGQLREHMDGDCDVQRLERTYTQFSVVNQLLAGWQIVYKTYLQPVLSSGHTRLLDIGSGGGDLARQLAAWAARDGYSLEITMSDPDARAYRYAAKRALPPNVRLLGSHSAELLAAGERFDVIVSNHLLHHLTKEELESLCADSQQLATKLVVHNDIRRSDLAYLGFSLSKLFFRRSFVTNDGLRSIRRSYTRTELEQISPNGWRVETLFPYRNLLLWRA